MPYISFEGPVFPNGIIAAYNAGLAAAAPAEAEAALAD